MRDYHRGDRNQVKHARMLLVTHLMFEGTNLIVDNCNLNPHDLHHYKSLAKQYDYKVKIVNFTDIPLELCIERNKRSENPVPETLIRALHHRWIKPDDEEIVNKVNSI